MKLRRALRFSLLTKILGWALLNLLLVGAILLFIFNLDFRFSPRSPFFRESANRIEAVSRLVSQEMTAAARGERDEALARYAAAYEVDFYVFDRELQQLAGPEKTLPAEVVEEVRKLQANLPPPGAPPAMPPPVGRGDGALRGAAVPRPPFRPPFLIKTNDPTLYWSGSPMLIFDAAGGPPRGAMLLTASTSFSGNGLYFDPRPWLVIVGVVVGFSILFWLPIVRGMTKTVEQMTAAAEKIAEEEFDVQVSASRRDELGRLGRAINHLAARLSGFVYGQKRFLGDISHELNSPLARLQLALELIADESDERAQPYLEKAREEVQLMTRLVSEVMTYSKAGIKAAEVTLEPVALGELVARVAERENARENAPIEIDVDEQTRVLAHDEMLARAVGNVVRNAIRYAGRSGPIRIEARTAKEQVRLTIADEGPGVPDEALEKLFDPFYRVDSDRSRASGGTGLGLAIVKTCVEACEGKVAAANRTPRGLEIQITLLRVES